MPTLRRARNSGNAKIQDEVRGKDLVIVGIHVPSGEDDEINTGKRLDEKLAEVRRKFWNGRDIAFPVVMTRPRKG